MTDIRAIGRFVLNQPHTTLSWKRELALVIAFLVPYDLIRLAAANDRDVGVRHARDVLGLEHHLGLDVERALNHALAAHHALEAAAGFWYAGLHYLVTPAVLILLYRRAPERYQRARLALMAATAVALGGYLLFPTAPPRFLPGYVDTMVATADVGWWTTNASAGLNELAAMPSMHVGWALWCALVLSGLARRPLLKALAFAYPAITTLVVVATANHWVLDAVAGAALVLGAWRALTPHPERQPVYVAMSG
ncbi:phosphatase PAP2 family protein [Cryptosporangium phraense]|nr:phosphatase PAP2 family protein [Cryptosporangium phraense]